jgi:RHS repeat-associated protein
LTTGASAPNDIDWAGAEYSAYRTPDAWQLSPGWAGSLLRDQRDESGLLYRRNRYFDPSTARFTQEDPIGLVGGMNLYGFAGGDPVSYSDPFGLCPLCLVWGAYEIGSGIYDAYQAYKAVTDRNATTREKVGTVALAGIGLFAPGGGYSGFGKGGRFVFTTADSWGNAGELARHFRDHGSDFGARTADEYAAKASDFLQRALRERLPTKIDSDGVIRVYDPRSNTFGSYNPDGTTRTFYKPETKGAYWKKQPGIAP